ncbi:hypothetical protein B0H14DRAFT_2585182 [Mycena olivaceomarginata]|nr:hypothetical protein B0H14DRAFT_2585182 [Mycena olivaceomarginata]
MPQWSLDVLLQAAIVPNTGLKHWRAASSPPGADSVAPLNSTLDRGSLAFCQLRHVQQPRASCSAYENKNSGNPTHDKKSAPNGTCTGSLTGSDDLFGLCYSDMHPVSQEATAD